MMFGFAPPAEDEGCVVPCACAIWTGAIAEKAAMVASELEAASTLRRLKSSVVFLSVITLSLDVSRSETRDGWSTCRSARHGVRPVDSGGNNLAHRDASRP